MQYEPPAISGIINVRKSHVITEKPADLCDIDAGTFNPASYELGTLSNAFNSVRYHFAQARRLKSPGRKKEALAQASNKFKPAFLGKTLTLQLNVRNAFNQSRVQPARYTNDFLGLRRVTLNDARSFRFTTTLDF